MWIESNNIKSRFWRTVFSSMEPKDSGGAMGGIVDAWFRPLSFLNVIERRGPQVGVNEGGMLCSHAHCELAVML